MTLMTIWRDGGLMKRASKKATKTVKKNHWTEDPVTETYMEKWAHASDAEAVEKMTHTLEASGKQLKDLATTPTQNVCPEEEEE